jgi:RNA polymerase I-specific transcription initiation factor RRN11
MSTSDHDFLFASLGDKPPQTARKIHLRRLYDILQLSIQRHDLDRARRAWAILVRCRELDWKTTWKTSLYLLDQQDVDDESMGAVDFLKSMTRQHSENVRHLLGSEHLLRASLSAKLFCARLSFARSRMVNLVPR